MVVGEVWRFTDKSIVIGRRGPGPNVAIISEQCVSCSRGVQDSAASGDGVDSKP